MRLLVAYWFKNVIIYGGLQILLISCGGGAEPDQPITLPPSQTLADQIDARDQLLASYTNPINYTELTQIPTTGSASYRGYLFGTLSNTTDTVTDSLSADFEMTIEFNQASVDVVGRASNVFGDDGASLTGHLTLGNATLDRGGNPNTDPTLALEITGELTETDGDAIDLIGLLEGDFLGAQYQAAGGAVFGRAVTSGVSQNFDGGFIAER